MLGLATCLVQMLDVWPSDKHAGNAREFWLSGCVILRLIITLMLSFKLLSLGEHAQSEAVLTAFNRP
jgi:hypothetical protein